MKKVLLLGNPNAGKSTIFNLLTHSHARVGNYQGVTVSPSEGVCRFKKQKFIICDLPGIFSLKPMTMEEKVAVDALKKDCLILLVIDALNIVSSLKLLCELKNSGLAVACVVTKYENLKKGGGDVSLSALRATFDVPCVEFDKKRLKQFILQCLSSFDGEGLVSSDKDVFSIDKITLSDIYSPSKFNGGRVEKLLLSGWFSAIFFIIYISFAFAFSFAKGFPCDRLKGFLEEVICCDLSNIVGSFLRKGGANPVTIDFLCAGIIESVGALISFLPQLLSLELFFLLLESSGIMSYLAFMTDGIFSKFSLNGRMVFSLLAGFGCSAVAAMSTRTFEDKKRQRQALLMLPYVQCSAKLPFFLTFCASLFPNPFVAVVGIYLFGVVLSLIIAKIFSGEREDIVMGLSPLQIPQFKQVAKSLLFYAKTFIIKIGSVVLCFFILSWVLCHFNFSLEFVSVEDSIMAKIGEFFSFLFYPMGISDWRYAVSCLSGLIAKENVAGMLSYFFPTGAIISFESGVALIVFIATCSPCVSAISAVGGELGVKKAIKYAFLQTIFSFILSYCAFAVLYLGRLIF